MVNSVLNLEELEYYLKSISKISIRDIYKNTDVFTEIINKLKTNPEAIYNKDNVRNLINIKYDENGTINKLDLESKLIFFNTIGMTIIEPNPNQIFIENYDFRLPFNTGCQFITMAYQNEENQI